MSAPCSATSILFRWLGFLVYGGFRNSGFLQFAQACILEDNRYMLEEAQIKV